MLNIKQVDAVDNRQTSRTIAIVVFALLLAIFIFYSRMQYRAPYLYSWDSVSFALSIERFDMKLHQPHPPGYFLYSHTIRLLNLIVQDPNLTMIYLNILATIGACWFIGKLVYLLTKNALAAGAAAALYAFNPIVWFYGSVAEVYAVEGFWVAVIAYFVISSRIQPQHLLLGSVAMGLAGGFRPSTELFLLPFFATAWFHRRYVLTLLSICLLIIVNLAWLVPLSESVGGITEYTRALREQSQRAADVTAELPAERMSWTKIGVRMIQTITPILILFLFARLRRFEGNWSLASLLLVIVPALLVFGLLHFPKDGYLLLVVPLLIAAAIVLLAQSGLPNKILAAAVLVACAMSFTGYLWPFAAKSTVGEVTRPNVQILEGRMDRLTKFFQIVEGLGGGRPKTFILENRHYFPSWRMLLYYYPEHTVYLVWPNKKRAYLAEQHEYTTVMPPLRVDSSSILVAVGKSSLSFPAQSFQVDSFRYYFAEAWNLSRKFPVYSMPAVIVHEE